MLLTTCRNDYGHQIFGGRAQFISVAGNIETNAQVANSTTETAVLTTSSLPAGLLNETSMGFRVVLGGEISSSGSGDCTLTLRYGTTDVIAVVTVGLANEDDKVWRAVYEGHILTAGASGKIVGAGSLIAYQTTVLQFAGKTALTGASVTLTTAGTFNVTAHWDNASADDDIIATYGWAEFYN